MAIGLVSSAPHPRHTYSAKILAESGCGCKSRVWRGCCPSAGSPKGIQAGPPAIILSWFSMFSSVDWTGALRGSRVSGGARGSRGTRGTRGLMTGAKARGFMVYSNILSWHSGCRIGWYPSWWRSHESPRERVAYHKCTSWPTAVRLNRIKERNQIDPECCRCPKIMPGCSLMCTHASACRDPIVRP